MRRTILVADDEAHIIQVLTIKLRHAGYRVIVAYDGEEALELARESRPDLLITDHHMPYMTGLELCAALIDDERTTDIPVILLTARGYAFDTEDIPTPNVQRVLAKPFSPRGIVKHVEDLLAADWHQPRAA